jgi:uncharacterized protein
VSDGPSPDEARSDVEVLPLFPLGTVLVPGLVLPLHVFEPRYRAMVADLLLLPEDRREFGVVAIREGHEVGADAVRALHAVGTTARIVRMVPHDDGRYDLVTTGVRRFRLDAVIAGRPYLRARVTPLAEPDGPASADLGRAVGRRFAAYRAAVAAAGAEEAAAMPDLPADPTVLSYLVIAAMVLDLADRQRLLECPDAATRLQEESRLLARETGLLRHLPSLPAVELARTTSDLN